MLLVDSRGCIVIRLTVGEDMTTDYGYRYAQSAVNNAPRDNTMFLWSAIPCTCTGGSPWQSLNKRLPGGMERIQEHWALSWKLWKKRICFVDWLSQTGRKWRICIVWPKGCDYWRWKTVRSFLHKYKLQEVCVDGCAIGLKARSGELTKKPRRVCTNDENILIALRPLQWSNTSNPATDHHHAECK